MAARQGDGDDRVLVGAIVGPHGIRGDVRVKSFTGEPAALAAYGPVQTEDGARSLSLTVRGQSKGLLICGVKGIADRNAAEALKGVRLYLPRAALPAAAEEEDEFYHADLVGLRAEMADGSGVIGEVVAVFDFGAGDILEVKPVEGGVTAKPVMIPFTRAVCPAVEPAQDRILVEPPAGLIDEVDRRAGRTVHARPEPADGQEAE